MLTALTLSLGLALSSVPQTQTGDWMTFALSPDGVGAIDMANIQTNGDLRTAWVVYGFPAGAIEGLDYGVDKTLFDCRARTAKVQYSYLYTLDGTVVDSFEDPSAPEAQDPGTPGALMIDMACTGRAGGSGQSTARAVVLEFRR